MPNVKGGKNYKKSKNSSGQTEPEFIERAEDQLYARVIKLLGNCNILVFCNDNKRRICHIRGGLRKKVWLNVGDLVLISLREFLKDDDDKYGRGDIIDKFDPSHFSKLKRDPLFNQVLLNPVEKLSEDSDVWDKIGYKEMLNDNKMDDGFEFESDMKDKDEKDEGEESDDSHDERKKPNYNKKRAEKEVSYNLNGSAPSLAQKKMAINNNDEIDIDAI